MSQGTDLAAPLVVSNSGRWIGNDGSWSTFYVNVGTPPQYFHVFPNFNGQTIYVPIDKDCEPDRMNITDCGGQRGVEIFNSRPSLGFHKNVSSTWDERGIYRMGLGVNLGLTGNAYYGYDTFGLGTNSAANATKIEKLAVAAYATPDFWVGQLGLNPFPIVMGETERPHSFLARLKEEGKIPSLSFGYQAGAIYRYTKVPGSLVLGGYDRSLQSKKILTAPSTIDTIVGVQSISSKFSNGTSTNLLNTGITATIDTNTQSIWLPRLVCDSFASALGLTYFEAADRYVLTDTVRAALLASAPTFSFAIGTSVSGGETINIDIPYAAFDLQAGYPIFGTRTNYFPLRRAANDSQFSLGRVFLQEVYMSVDWERDIFNISQAVFNSPPLAPDFVTIEPKNRTNILIPRPLPTNKTLSAGAIAGIVVGALALLALIAGLAWWIYRRKPKAKTDTETSQALPVDEKKGPDDFGPEVADKPPAETRTNLELEGRMVEEMYAPLGHHEMHDGSKPPEQQTEIVEVDSQSPIYELPSPDHEAMRRS
ncbi:aspartic peptidase domain-containing protein [Phaeosphaeriaceae sp. PMI808]|nr:aspartic peptidase domain-containing protein [Phaeosphaeriaceae sp. PMI808]